MTTQSRRFPAFVAGAEAGSPKLRLAEGLGNTAINARVPLTRCLQYEQPIGQPRKLTLEAALIVFVAFGL